MQLSPNARTSARIAARRINNAAPPTGPRHSPPSPPPRATSRRRTNGGAAVTGSRRNQARDPTPPPSAPGASGSRHRHQPERHRARAPTPAHQPPENTPASSTRSRSRAGTPNTGNSSPPASSLRSPDADDEDILAALEATPATRATGRRGNPIPVGNRVHFEPTGVISPTSMGNMINQVVQPLVAAITSQATATTQAISSLVPGGSVFVPKKASDTPLQAFLRPNFQMVNLEDLLAHYRGEKKDYKRVVIPPCISTVGLAHQYFARTMQHLLKHGSAVSQIEAAWFSSFVNLFNTLVGDPDRAYDHVLHWCINRLRTYLDDPSEESLTFKEVMFMSLKPLHRTTAGSSSMTGGGGHASSSASYGRSTGGGAGRAQNKGRGSATTTLPRPVLKLNANGSPAVACATCRLVGWTKSRCPVCNKVPLDHWRAWDTRDPNTLTALRNNNWPDPAPYAATNEYTFGRN